MSSVQQIISEAYASDVVLYLKGDQLAYVASGDHFPLELREKIAINKAGIIAYLREFGQSPLPASGAPLLMFSGAPGFETASMSPSKEAVSTASAAVDDLLKELAMRGVEIYVEEGGLKTRSSAGAITQELGLRIREHRRQLIDLLGAAPARSERDATKVPDHLAAALDDLLTELAERGVDIYVEGGSLKTRSNPGAITQELGLRIREYKQHLIELLGDSAGTPATRDAMVALPLEGEHELSFSQQRLWFLDHFESGNSSYNIPVALRLEGRLNRDALQRSFDEIVKRHAVLRSTYKKSAAGGVQCVNAPAPVPIRVFEIKQGSDASSGAEVARLFRDEVTKPFSLSDDLMLRVSLAKLADDHHILYLTLHHIASDGWSLGVLVKEFTALYEAFSQDRESPLAPLEFQYIDFAKWQRKQYRVERMERELAFWREMLDGIPQIHSLPLDKPRPVHQSAQGRSLPYRLDISRLMSLREFAKSRNATLFMVLQSAFALLLSRWTGMPDVVVGTPVAGRSLPMTESLIGFFVNTLVLRTTLRDPMTYEELLERSKDQTLGAYEHQYTPFEMLVESLNPERSLSHSPLFQVMFALQNYQVGSLQLSELNIAEITPDTVSAKFDLSVVAVERSNGMTLAWVYAEHLFSASTIDSMAASFDNLLKEMVAGPERDVLDLPLLSTTHRFAVIALAAGKDRRLVLDSRGNVQPVGALGQVYAFDDLGAEAVGRLSGSLAAHLRPTGELGRLGAEGEIEVVALAEREVHLNGARIPAKTIDDTLLARGDIAEACTLARAVSHQDGNDAPVLVSYVVPRHNSGTDERAQFADECRRYLQGELPDFLVPKAVVTLASLPLLPDGRIDVMQFPTPELAGVVKAEYVPPAHDLEARLCEIWKAVLSLDRVGINDNFFEVGGTSMHSIILQQEILEKLGREVSITDLFAYPTVAGLVRYLQGEQEAVAETPSYESSDAQDPIAIIGMAGRFPDAKDVDTFWNNIRAGVESLRVFSDDELRANGVSSALLNNPDYVKSGVLLDHIETFDAGFFGFTPREAELADPQQRLLFECAVEALEHAGYGDDTRKRSVAVYVGVGESRYLFEHLLPQSSLIESMQAAAVYGNRPDYAATRLSYRLNLSGPSVSVGTACSTSLVAVHSACNSLRNNECDMALAGGASILRLGPQGYLYEEGSISSPDGHCRTFDIEARGTRGGSGAGLVVLKRLSRALVDGDTVYALIKGSAINNDGSDKVGYTAPSVFGQAQAIHQAQRAAGVEARSIQYVETHGTATELGDPIEIKALTSAFGKVDAQHCALGTVKPNIGHLDSAAGVAGLIKTVKALTERQMPPCINFVAPNPKIDFEHSPFFVNTQLRDWARGETPRRAGVSSFGIGGTNAHVVLEEAPEPLPGHSRRAAQLFVLSAKSETALANASSNLLAHLRQHAELATADVAHTLQSGRTPYAFRSAFLATSIDDAIDALEGKRVQPVMSAHCEAGKQPSVVFMFTGQGAQYVGMGKDLYQTEPFFADIVDRCAGILRDEFELDLHGLLFPAAPGGADMLEAEHQLDRTAAAQPALFVLEFAIASLLMRWGITPAAMIGHSLGEYVAACLAGVFTLEEGVRLVARRGRLMQDLRAGRMLSIQSSESHALPLLKSVGADLAAVNGPGDCVASGTEEAIQALAGTLDSLGISYRELRTSHAFHSVMMEAIREPFREVLNGVALKQPRLPYISNVTGRLVRAEEAVDPAYWIAHMRGTVRFADGIEALAGNTTLLRPERVYLEIGPGSTLQSLTRKNVSLQGMRTLSTTRHRHELHPDDQHLLKTVAQLWLSGVPIDWARVHEGERCLRVALPTYPFERQRYWIEKGEQKPAVARSGRKQSPHDWFYVPTWKQLGPARRVKESGDEDRTQKPLWLVFCDGLGVGQAICAQLRSQGSESISVSMDQSFRCMDGNSFALNPAVEEDFARLLKSIEMAAARPIHAIHLFGLDRVDGASAASMDMGGFDLAQERGFDSVLFLTRTVSTICPTSPLTLDLVTDSVLSVTGEEELRTDSAPALGLCKVLPQELPQLRAYHIDIRVRGNERRIPVETLATQILAEANAKQRLAQVAYRGIKRWGCRYEDCKADADDAQHVALGKHYVITGGLGNIGLLLAEELARQGAGGILLISRRTLPDRQLWNELSAIDIDTGMQPTLARLQRIESSGTEILLAAADVSDYESMREAFDLAERKFGRIEGIIHAAGHVHAAVQAHDQITVASRQEYFLAKVQGTRVLERIIQDRDVGFCMLMSSLSSVLGGLGFGAYASANSYMDAFAHARHNQGDRRWLAVDWDGWIFDTQKKLVGSSHEHTGMLPSEGLQAFARALQFMHLPQLVHSTVDIEQRIQQWIHFETGMPKQRSLHARPDMQTSLVEASTDTEKKLVTIWQDVLGIELIGTRDNFFELGGDSMMLVQVHKAVREQAGADVTVAHLFQFPSIGELAAFIDKNSEVVSAESIVSMRLNRRRARDGDAVPDKAPA